MWPIQNLCWFVHKCAHDTLAEKQLVRSDIFAPSLVVLGLYMLDDLVAQAAYGGEKIPLEITKCATFDRFGQQTTDRDCITVAFAPNSAKHVSQMQQLAADNKLDFGVDVVGFASDVALANHMMNNLGTIDSAVIFDAPDLRCEPQLRAASAACSAPGVPGVPVVDLAGGEPVCLTDALGAGAGVAMGALGIDANAFCTASPIERVFSHMNPTRFLPRISQFERCCMRRQRLLPAAGRRCAS